MFGLGAWLDSADYVGRSGESIWRCLARHALCRMVEEAGRVCKWRQKWTDPAQSGGTLNGAHRKLLLSAWSCSGLLLIQMSYGHCSNSNLVEEEM